jgi:hypothetical protein
VLVFGGSQGARSINEAVIAAHGGWGQRKLQLLHATGGAGYTAAARAWEQARTDHPDGPPVKLVEFIDDMASAYAAADVVVCRAGATSIAELTVLGLPSVLIPYPYATADHQRENAEALARAGGAAVIEDEDLDGRTARRDPGPAARRPRGLRRDGAGRPRLRTSRRRCRRRPPRARARPGGTPDVMPPLTPDRHVHLVGIGGAGMSGLARILLTRGHRVSGSDLRDGRALEELRVLGADIAVGHRADNIGAAEVVVTSSAVPADNPELVAAASGAARCSAALSCWPSSWPMIRRSSWPVPTARPPPPR